VNEQTDCCCCLWVYVAGRFTVENCVDIAEIARQIKNKKRRLLSKDGLLKSFCCFCSCLPF